MRGAKYAPARIQSLTGAFLRFGITALLIEHIGEIVHRLQRVRIPSAQEAVPDFRGGEQRAGFRKRAEAPIDVAHHMHHLGLDLTVLGQPVSISLEALSRISFARM